MNPFGFLLNLLLAGCCTGFLGLVILTIYQMLGPRIILSPEDKQRALLAFRLALAVSVLIGIISFLGYTLTRLAGF